MKRQKTLHFLDSIETNADALRNNKEISFDAYSEDSSHEESDLYTRSKNTYASNDRDIKGRSRLEKWLPTSRLGMKLEDDVFEIKDIRKMPIPREDGYQWTERERQADEVNARPFGKASWDDENERLKIVQKHPNYRFYGEIAGVMQRDPLRLFVDEDITRLAREEEDWRARMALERRRSLVSQEEKFKSIKQLKELSEETRTNLKNVIHNRPSIQLLTLSKRVIDNSQLERRDDVFYRSYGVVGLLALKLQYDLIDNIANGELDDNEKLPWFSMRVKEEIGSMIRRMKSSPETLDFANRVETIARGIQDHRERVDLFLFLLYYRDFMQTNRYDDDWISLKNSVLVKLLFTLNPITEIFSRDKSYAQQASLYGLVREERIGEETRPRLPEPEPRLEIPEMDVDSEEEDFFGKEVAEPSLSAQPTLVKQDVPIVSTSTMTPLTGRTKRLDEKESIELKHISSDIGRDRVKLLDICHILGIENDIWVKLNVIYDKPSELGIDWDFYNHERMLNMDFALPLSRQEERTALNLGCKFCYPDKSDIYCDDMARYIV